LRAGFLTRTNRLQNREMAMNWEQIEGKWNQYAGKVQEKWGKLTDSDLQTMHGKREQLVGKIQERYGIAKEEAQKQVEEYFKSLPEDSAERSDKARGAGRS
jgi:uncharacterized protein YjbJ (UPF0337 family)